MKVLSEQQVSKILERAVTKETLLTKFQPEMLSALQNIETNPKVIPPRTVTTSNTEECDSTHLFMPCIGNHKVGMKLLTGGPSNTAKGLGFVGSIVVIDEYDGTLKGVLNAKSITAFRTALASSLPLTKTFDVENPPSNLLPELSVFGVGLQAYWHVKLALLLYSHIKVVNIVNRTLTNAESLAERLSSEFPTVKMNPVASENEDSVKKCVQTSSIIFGCCPSTSPVIKHDYINKDPQYPKFMSLIGSFKPHMIELDLNFIATEFESTKVIVDNKHDALIESGELIQGEKSESDLVTIAEYLTGKNVETKSPSNVVWLKIVGLSIMDITVANVVLSMAGNDGVVVEDF